MSLKLNDFLQVFNANVMKPQRTQAIEGDFVAASEVDGNLYFSIRSLNNELSAVIFGPNEKDSEERKAEKLQRQAQIKACQTGDKIRIWGVPSIFEQKLQIWVNGLEVPQEKGDFFQQHLADIERLKPLLKRTKRKENNQLAELSEPLKKGDIAIVTSDKGKARKDVIDALNSDDEKNYHLWDEADSERCFFKTRVQGKNALDAICKALKAADAGGFRFIILCRGGGSLSELSVFEQAELAECIAQMKTPIITAIGHEEDEFLADLAATYSAATPTAAGRDLLNKNHRFYSNRSKKNARQREENTQNALKDTQNALSAKENALSAKDSEIAEARKQGKITGAIITAIVLLILWAIFD